MNEQSLAAIKAMQLGEITEHVIYGYMARRVPGENGRTLARIAAEEKKHAEIWSGFTGEMPKPNRLKIALYRICGVIFGLTFVINMMETGEQKAQAEYAKIAEAAPVALEIFKQEEEHEQALIAMIDDERLQYISSMVLGINDALVELTGALAGFTFALGQSARWCFDIDDACGKLDRYARPNFLALRHSAVICMANFTGFHPTLSMAAIDVKAGPSEGWRR